MVNTKISQKMKNKSLLSIEKNIIEWEKYIYINLDKGNYKFTSKVDLDEKSKKL